MTVIVLFLHFELEAPSHLTASESIQQIIRHIGQEVAPAIHHLAKDRLRQFDTVSFIINMHNGPNGRQHNDFINKSSSVTSTSKALFASFFS